MSDHSSSSVSSQQDLVSLILPLPRIVSSLLPSITSKCCCCSSKCCCFPSSFQQTISLTSHLGWNFFFRVVGRYISKCPGLKILGEWEKYTPWTEIPIDLGPNKIHIFVGGQPIKFLGYKWQLSQLKAKKITHVIDLTSSKEKSCFLRPITKDDWQVSGITYTHISCKDFKGISPQYLAKIYEVVKKHIHENSGNIYIHCSKGKGRSPSAAIGTILAINGTQEKPAEAAVQKIFNIMKEARPEIAFTDEQLQTTIAFVQETVINKSSSNSSNPSCSSSSSNSSSSPCPFKKED